MTARTVGCLPGCMTTPRMRRPAFWDGRAWSPYVRLDVLSKEDALRLRRALGAFLDSWVRAGLITRRVWECFDLERLKSYALWPRARGAGASGRGGRAGRAGSCHVRRGGRISPKAPAASSSRRLRVSARARGRLAALARVMRGHAWAAPGPARGPTAGERFRHAVGSDLALPPASSPLTACCCCCRGGVRSSCSLGVTSSATCDLSLRSPSRSRSSSPLVPLSAASSSVRRRHAVLGGGWVLPILAD